MPYIQALRHNRIFHTNDNFDKRCDDLEKFLLDVVYQSKLTRKEIPRARAIPKEILLNEEKEQVSKEQITSNITH